MELGTFSVSLAVNNLATSRAFYEKLGFAVIREDQAQSWLILRCGETTIGLFQGVFPRNTLTFNPGLRGSTMVPLDDFDDVREIQAHLKDQGLTLAVETSSEESGPGHIMLIDPDGNPILIEQHT